MNRFHARLAGRGSTVAAFESSPEPRTIGSFARGRQLIAGNLLFAGFLVQKPAHMIWDIEMPSTHFETALHGFQWLDDLAAVGDIRARDAAQSWTWGWITAFGGGKGAGWSPSLTGRRLIRWINHAVFLLNGRKPEQSEAYFRSLAGQCRFLARRWKAAPQGLPRFEALVGLIYAGLALKGMDKHAEPATRALARECEKQINEEGGLPTRNPEELLEVFTLLTWANLALQESGKTPPAALLRTIERIAPTLRALRHADGGLARFHGGDRGLDGRLDHALANCGVRSRVGDGPRAMGFARLSAGRTTVIQDAAAPPTGHASTNAHASTLSFELTSGRRPLIVNCGSGTSFGDSWRRAGRATPSHSTLGITGFSSSRLEQRSAKTKEPVWERLIEVPKDVRLQKETSPDGTFLLGGHSGYVATHGLTHVRKLTMSPDGRQVSGDDTLSAFTAKDRSIFDDTMTRSRMTGAEFTIRFHLHPDVDAKLDLGGTAVSLALKSMEIWIFRHDGLADLTLEPSVYLEAGRLKPRSSRQIVLTSKVLDYARQIRWTLAKAQDTPQGIRDLARSDDLPLD